MSLIDPDAAHVVEFSKYPRILSTHWLTYSMNISVDYKVAVSKPTLYIGSVGSPRKAATGGGSGVPWRSIYCIRYIAANFHRDYKNENWKRQVVKIAHKLEPHIFHQRMTRLESDMEG
ncbi:hypothetical protein GOBAR_AA18448 [Gossypium barbadense]|uniref:Uncharacterized protein n=1 Tax=Gossypium barbadense TaxID=3634 RepID=A0A2P5XFU0_GOSBA|nr:hypothetical protein GOBAR_AA18448 [Gossypium barbadense]